METLPWIAACSWRCRCSRLRRCSRGIWLVAAPAPASQPLPTEWALSARPVFSTDERRVYKLLREALPHHVVLSKLPLVRFCQPSDPAEVRYWYDLLGAINVTFAVCSANGRVLAAIDLDTDRGNSRRILQIKQSVLGACRVRYLRCPVDNLPLGRRAAAAGAERHRRGARPQPASRRRATSTKRAIRSPARWRHRRAQRTALWQDSSLFQDSFFAPDSRLDSFGSSEFAGLAAAPLAAVNSQRSRLRHRASATATIGRPLQRAACRRRRRRRRGRRQPKRRPSRARHR